MYFPLQAVQSTFKFDPVKFIPTQALLRTPVLRLTVMLRMLKIFPEDLFGNDDIICVNGTAVKTHIYPHPVTNQVIRLERST